MLLASEIADFLGEKMRGEDIKIAGVCSLANPIKDSVLFAKEIKRQQIVHLNEIGKILALCDKDQSDSLFTSIVVPNPRLAFARVVARCFSRRKIAGIANSAVIGNSELGDGVTIGQHVVIEDGVKIGDGTIIEHNSVIHQNVEIGKNCYIKANATIGGKGFGFERDMNGVPIEIPHIGGVTIGDYVEIGANATVVSGTIDKTIIEDHVKIDDHVHIAHNVLVGAGTLITACSEVSGSVRLGRKCWIGPNSSIRDGVIVEDEAFIGIGAVVTKSVPKSNVVAGNPAKDLPKKTKPNFES